MRSSTLTQTPAASSVVGLGLRVPGRATNAVVVRLALRVWLESLTARDEQVFALLIAVNEAFANAVEHPRDPSSTSVDVAARYEGRMVEVTVRDHRGWRKEATEGHRSVGLLLMEAFVDKVTVHSDHRGTFVLLQQRLQLPYERAAAEEAHAWRRPRPERRTLVPGSTQTGSSRVSVT
jgi:anti-sigma regulatory factor (Ser/Thr protein kinase)